MRIGIIGAGTMGEILLTGFIRHAPADTHHEVVVFDRNPEKLAFVQENYGATPCKDELDCSSKSQILFICVKPKDVLECVKKIAPTLRAPKILVSIAAGMTTEKMQSSLGAFNRIARLMPNTPCQIQQGALIYYFCETLGADERRQLIELVSPLGWVGTVEQEKLLDSVTAIGGSGPAHLFTLAEWMIQSATDHGMPTALARQLVTQTLKGASQLLHESGQSPEELTAAVRTPKGTTDAALVSLEKDRVKEHFLKALDLSTQRALELSKN